MRRGQSATEYLIMVAGVIFVAVFLFLMLKGELFHGAAGSTRNSSRDFIDEYGKPYAFYDTFSTDSLYRWKNVVPGWSIRNGVLEEVATGFGFIPLIVGDTTWQNYIIAADVFPVSNQPTGVVARYSTESSFFYFCGINNRQLVVLMLCEYGQVNPCFALNLTGIEDTPWFHVYFKVDGPSLTCMVNTNQSTSLSVMNNNTEFGAPGIYGYSAGGKFDNFKVTNLPPAVSFQQTPTSLKILNPQCTRTDAGVPLGSKQVLTFTWQTTLPTDAVVKIANRSTAFSPALTFTLRNYTVSADHNQMIQLSTWYGGDTFFATLMGAYNHFYVKSDELACPALPSCLPGPSCP